MTKKLLQYIVILLGILIIFAFIALIYGMYLKISKNQNAFDVDPKEISLNLSNNDEIIEINVIDHEKLLIIINQEDKLKAAIYNIKMQKITEFIEK
tara:strand:- start:128 stop:415 length:288 start_codon:yes stop_codon:yes gene_type:complete